MVYGFRLFQIELVIGRSVQPFNRSTKPGWDLDLDVLGAFNAQNGVKHRGMPRRSEDEDGEIDPNGHEADAPIIRVAEFSHRGFHTTAVIEFGRPSGHHMAAALDDDNDVDISRHAPIRPYRIALIAPRDQTKGVLVVETYGRACPQAPVVRWLNRWIDDRRQASSTAAVKYRIRAASLADNDGLQRTIEQAKAEKLVLRRSTVGASRQRRSVDLEVTAPIQAGSRLDRARETLANWFGGAPKPIDGNVKAQSIADVAAILGYDVEGWGFDDAWIVVEDEYGAPKRLSPDRLPDVFTYPLTDDVRPSDLAFYGGARSAIERVAVSAELPPIDWGNW